MNARALNSPRLGHLNFKGPFVVAGCLAGWLTMMLLCYLNNNCSTLPAAISENRMHDIADGRSVVGCCCLIFPYPFHARYWDRQPVDRCFHPPPPPPLWCITQIIWEFPPTFIMIGLSFCSAHTILYPLSFIRLVCWFGWSVERRAMNVELYELLIY